MPNILVENNAYILTELEPNIYHWHFKAAQLVLSDYLIVYHMAIDKYKETGYKANIVTTHELTFSFAPETWNFIVDRNTDFSFINAQAVVVKQLHLRVLARIIKMTRKKAYKYQIFATYDDALNWLKTVS